MTIPTPSPAGSLKARNFAAPRLLAAWALLAYAGLFLLLEFIELILPHNGSLLRWAAGADFRSLLIMAMPVLAALLAVHVTPRLPGARTVTLVALAEYAFALFFGLITLLLGLGSVLGGVNGLESSFGAFRYFVVGVADLALIAVAAYVTWHTFRLVGGSL